MSETTSGDIKGMISDIIAKPEVMTDIRMLQIMEKLNQRIDEVARDVQQILDPVRHETPKYKYLGYENAWGATWPPEVSACVEAKHRRTAIPLNTERTHKEIFCDKCMIQWRVDSSF